MGASLLFLLLVLVLNYYSSSFVHSRKVPCISIAGLSSFKNVGEDAIRLHSGALFARGPPRRIPRSSGYPDEPPIKSIRRKWNSLDYRNLINVTNGLVFANVLMYLLTMLDPGIKSRWLKSNRAIRYYGQGYRLLSSLFVHGNLYHIGMNSYSLINIGPAAQSAFGSMRYVIIYLASGIFANLVTYLTDTSPFSLGASGCTFGLIGALGAYLYQNKKVLGPSADRGLSSIKQTMMINLMYGFSMQGIDNMAHIYGFIGGGAASYLIGPRKSRFKKNGRTGTVDRPRIDLKKIGRKLGAIFGIGAISADSDAGFRPKRFPIDD